MNPRERVLAVLDNHEPDIVPIYVTVTPQLAQGLSDLLGIDSYTVADSPSQNRISYQEILTELGNDVVGIGACYPKDNPTKNLGGGITQNEWGVKYRAIGYYSEMIEHPLANAETVSDIARFPFPDPSSPGRFDLAKRVVESYGGEYGICGDVEMTIFERSWQLTGFAKLLMDLALEKDYVFELMDRIMDYSIGVGVELIHLGADFIWLGDDVGTQEGMLISPELWRKHHKPRLRQVIEKLKVENAAVKIAYHCCGSYASIIPDLIEIGVDILNALQPTARDMELGNLKKLYGDRVCFFGGLDIQGVLPFGSFEDVEREVRRVIWAAGDGGGLILAGAHNLQPDVSSEKVKNIFSTAKRYGKYPLR